ncbi:MAG: PAS domain-containing protein, partial [Candidatus Delongbacteria bacterium]|nr:PAS domain-containing protein [Candidatus Delongbacteria bacterium]
PKRAEYMLFSDPHLVFPGVIITTKDNQHLNNSKELYYKEVGIVSGYLWNEFIRKDHPQIKIVNVANITDGLRKVSTNQIDAFIATLPIALHYIEQEGIPNLVIAGETEYETKLSIHTRKDWPLLNSIMNKTLKAIPVEKKKNIINKWISLKHKSFFYQKDFWIIVLLFTGSGFLIVIVAFIWNSTLKKQVKIKTGELEKDIAIRKQAEEALNRSLIREKIQADIVRNAPIAIAFGYPDGRLENCNKAFSVLTGYSEEELKSINWSKVLTPEKWNTIESQELEKINPKNTSIVYEKEYIHKKGNTIPIELVVKANFGNDNNSLHYIAFITDITKRKNAETALKESEAKLKEAQIMAKIGNWELNLITNTLQWSDEIYRIFNFIPQEFKATYEGFLENIHPDDRDIVDAAYTKSLKDKESYSIVHRILLKDGTEKFVQEYCNTLFDDKDKPVRSIGTVQDITAIHKTEMELAKYRDHLEELVKERTYELEEKNEKLEKFNKLFVDREFRVKELKDRIKELESK